MNIEEITAEQPEKTNMIRLVAAATGKTVQEVQTTAAAALLDIMTNEKTDPATKFQCVKLIIG